MLTGNTTYRPHHARYGHTKIVRDMGAPPTAAQLGGPRAPPGGITSYGVGAPPIGGPPMGGPPMGGPPMGGPPMAGSSNNGYAPHQTHSQYATPQAGPYGQYGQSFGGSGGGGGVRHNFGQQPFGQPPPQEQHQQQIAPPRPAAYHQSASQTYPVPHSNLNSSTPGGSVNPLPTPGRYPYPPTGAGFAPPRASLPPAENYSEGRNGGGGYSVFNPATDRVVAADSTSSAVL